MQSGYANSTIATKLNIVRIFYKASQAHGLITSNPAAKVKAPKDRKDPAARITFMEAEELKFLLDYLQSQLDEAKTNKQRLVLMRVAKHAKRSFASRRKTTIWANALSEGLSRSNWHHELRRLQDGRNAPTQSSRYC